MLYELFKFLELEYDLPGAGLFLFNTFRAAISLLLSLVIAMVFGKRIIEFIRRKQLGETVRDLGLKGQMEKTGTPTMGGSIIILATLVPVLLFTKLNNIYIILLIFSMLWMGGIGFIDDYIKVFRKNKDGLSGKFKVFGQILLGIVVGVTLAFHPDVVMKKNLPMAEKKIEVVENNRIQREFFGESIKSLETNVPFLKNNSFNYKDFLYWMEDSAKNEWAWLVFVLVVVFIVAAVSNGANLTDGIDGLAAGTSAIIVGALAVFAFVSGNIIFADYLNIIFIPESSEIMIFCAAFIGGLIGFFWHNTYPAQVFMGDTGSLMVGGLIAVIAIILKKELLIPVLCGVFFAENLSVVIQVAWFKFTRIRTGTGRRIFLMSPLHHHFQKKGYHESKIVNRFLIIGFMLALITLITLKIR